MAKAESGGKPSLSVPPVQIHPCWRGFEASLRNASRHGELLLIVARIVAVPVAAATPALARLDRGFAIGGKLVEVGIEAGAAIAAGLVGGAEFLDVIAACAPEAMMPAIALFRALDAIPAAQDLAGMRLTGDHGQADKAGEKDGRF